MSVTSSKSQNAINLLGAIDQGTSSSRFIIFSENGAIVASHQETYPQIYPMAGYHEQDPQTILDSVVTCINEACKRLKEKGYTTADVKGVGLTNQRETTIVWDSSTGRPLYNALVWSDTRTSSTVAELISKTKSQDSLKSVCGLPISTYFSAVKLKWLIDNVPDVKKAHELGTLRFGTVDTWLIYNLTASKAHVTDVTNASRTMLLDLKTCQWSLEHCSLFGLNPSILPKVLSSSEIYGYFEQGPLKDIPICGCLGDQHAALVGQKCFNKGEIKTTFGTGCFTLANCGTLPSFSSNGLLSTIAYKLGKDQPTHYALEGSVAVAGSSIQWLRDNLGIIQTSEQVNQLAEQVKDSGDVYFVPAFSGLFAPYWRNDARGCIVGMTHYTNKCHIARATLEAICFQNTEVIECMNIDIRKQLKVDGGLTHSNICMQIQSDILGSEVIRPLMRETTALGAAIAAGLALGIYKNVDDVMKVIKDDKVDIFKPMTSDSLRKSKMSRWKEAVQKSMGWIK